MRKSGVFSLLLLFGVIIPACGGGGGSSSSPSAAPATQSISGIWIGTFTSKVTGTQEHITALISESNTARFASVTSLAQYSGLLSVTGNSFSAQLIACSPPGSLFRDGSFVGVVTITGTFAPQGTMSGTYSGVGDSGTVSLTYSTLYERPSTPAAVAGIWEGTLSGFATTLSIDPTGSIGGVSTSGCSYNGIIRIINPSYNAYSVDLVITDCGLQSGSYTGLAALTDTYTTNDTLFAELSGTGFSFVGSMKRQ